MSVLWRPVEEALEPVDAAQILADVEERFGIAPAVFDEFLIFRSSSKRLSIVRRGVRVPSRPKPEIVGMPFYRTKGRYPRLTTAAAMRFAPHIQRNVIDLEDTDMAPLLANGELILPSERLQNVSHTVDQGMDRDQDRRGGWVLLRRRGFILIFALFYSRDDGGGRLIVQLPRTWRDSGSG